MKLRAIFSFLFVSLSFGLMAQGVLDYDRPVTAEDDDVYIKHHNYEARPIPYTHLREADVLWTRRYWRRLDLRVKMNHPLYFPVQENLKDRKSLTKVIFQAVLDEGSITAYNDDEFSEILTPEMIKRGLFRTDTSVDIDIMTGAEIMRVDTTKVLPSDIYEYLIKEDVFFDKQRSVMEFRILGICPVATKTDPDTKQEYPEKLFWIWYPEARPVLAQNEVFNKGNSGERRTFEQIFHMRMFSSMIIKEENVYDREIFEYKKLNAMQQMLEARRIEEEIRNFEHDLWEY